MIASDHVGPSGETCLRPSGVDCDSPTDFHHCATSANSRLRQRADLISRQLSPSDLGEQRRGGPPLRLTGAPLHSRGRGRASLSPKGGEGRGEGAIRKLADLEREAIAQALDTLKGNRTLAAKALGIVRSTLQRKIREYGL